MINHSHVDTPINPPSNSEQFKQLDQLHKSGEWKYVSAATSTVGCLVCQRYREDFNFYRESRQVDALKKLRWIRESVEFISSNRDITMDNVDYLTRMEIQIVKWLAGDLDLSTAFVIRSPKSKN
jgi:hypothetical protein